MDKRKSEMKQKRNVFMVLASWMIGFGILIGGIFPFFAWTLGVSSSIAMSPTFFLACVAAGILVGVVNIVLARITVGQKLEFFTSKMMHAKENILMISQGGEIKDCSIENCHIPTDSDDKFSECGLAFNELIEAFAAVLKTQDAIRNYTEILASQLELDILADNALEVLMMHGKANAGAILLVHGDTYKSIANHGIEDVGSFQNNQVLKQVVKYKRHEMISYPEDLLVKGILVQYQPKQVLVLPIVFKDKVLGIIILATVHAFADELLKEIGIFVHSLALSLNNSLEHEELQRIAERDPLTNVYNRRSGLNMYQDEFKRSLDKGMSLSALMIDIDHFKKINDTYGHLTGDYILQQVTHLIKTTLRESDSLIRYGGEEFFVVLPNTDGIAAKQIAERLRAQVEAEVMRVKEMSVQVTISIGCGTLDPQSVRLESEFIRIIDEALYKAKEAGRNQIIIA